MLEFLRNRAANVSSSIKAPATNLTVGSGITAFLAAAVTAYNKTFEAIFGKHATEVTRREVLTVIILAFAAVAVADLLSRAITAAAHERGTAMVAAAGVGQSGVTPLFPGLPATLTTGVDEPGYLAVAMRSDAEGHQEYLVIKAGKKPKWVGQDGLQLTGL